MSRDIPIPVKVIKVYFDRVIVNRPHGCWLWPSNQTQSSGYGQLMIRLVRYGGKRRFLAHRASYTIHKGPIPSGLQVMHTCDNRACVNPKHLRIGTQLDNEADKVAKGRSSRGEKRWCATMSDCGAQKLLDEYRSGSSISRLAKKFRVTYWVAYSICKRLKWKYLT